KRFTICNIDVVIIAERPKLVPYKHSMCRVITETLGIDPGSVSVKAKTNETCGDIGTGKAIVVYASAMLKRRR
ncbi:MAG: 2-C-methyl-D-erythritol 2,4-cyclodiphosphate synthase, partial [Candidatus Omnitrophica bacterium]|nr:2-C-methyl-D-erythritol 2,4-cyclodiphosphate synthase [Candidatus Omnitrophota bacterium]